MSLQSQLQALVAAIGADVKALQASSSDSPKSWADPSAYSVTNLDRRGTFSTGLAALSSGRLTLTGIYLPAGLTVSNLSFMSGGTAGATLTNQWFALYASNLTLLRQSANAGSAAWVANTVKTLALSSSYVIPTSGFYYAGIMVAATTVPTLTGISSTAQLNGLTPILAGTSNTGLTTTAPSPANALSASAAIPLAMAS